MTESNVMLQRFESYEFRVCDDSLRFRQPLLVGQTRARIAQRSVEIQNGNPEGLRPLCPGFLSKSRRHYKIPGDQAEPYHTYPTTDYALIGRYAECFPSRFAIHPACCENRIDSVDSAVICFEKMNRLRDFDLKFMRHTK